MTEGGREIATRLTHEQKPPVRIGGGFCLSYAQQPDQERNVCRFDAETWQELDRRGLVGDVLEAAETVAVDVDHSPPCLRC